MYIIGIAGGTGSGKTTVVKKILETLPTDRVALIPQDSYYNDTTHLTMEERQRINFDHPDAFDWTLLTRQIQQLRAGQSIEQALATGGTVIAHRRNRIASRHQHGGCSQKKKLT
jgi:uridine kinase